MSAVTERAVLRMFATTPRDGLSLRDVNFLRSETGAFVRAVAEGLSGGTSAGAPPVSARLDFLHKGLFLTDDWFGHKFGNIPRLLENLLSR